MQPIFLVVGEPMGGRRGQEECGYRGECLSRNGYANREHPGTRAESRHPTLRSSSQGQCLVGTITSLRRGWSCSPSILESEPGADALNNKHRRWEKPKKHHAEGISWAWDGQPKPPRWWAERVMAETTPEGKQARFDEVPELLKDMVRAHCYATRDRRRIAKQVQQRRRRYEPWRFR